MFKNNKRCDSGSDDDTTGTRSDDIPHLPDEIWLKIFKELSPYKDFHNVSHVCTHFQRLIAYHAMTCRSVGWRKPDLKEAIKKISYSTEGPRPRGVIDGNLFNMHELRMMHRCKRNKMFFNELQQMIKYIAPYVRKIDLSGYFVMDPKENYWYEMMKCVQLRDLSVRHIPLLDHPRNLMPTGLVSLSMDGCHLNDELLHVIVGRNPHLQQLDISNNTRVVGRQIQKYTQLTALKMSNCSIHGDVFNTITNALTQLKVLHIDGIVPYLEESSLLLVLNRLPQLEELRIGTKGLPIMENVMWEFDKLKHLKMLTVFSSTNVDTMIHRLATHGNITTLDLAKAAHSWGLSSAINKFPKLEYLALATMQSRDDAFFDNLWPMQHLKKFRCVFNTFLADDNIVALVKKSVNLVRIDIRGHAAEITAELISKIIPDIQSRDNTTQLVILASYPVKEKSRAGGIILGKKMRRRILIVNEYNIYQHHRYEDED